jgi:anaerobic ribonucleoside-triphosphate reductase
MISVIIKRDGRKVPYDVERIRKAITSAAESCNYKGDQLDLVNNVVRAVERKINGSDSQVIDVEKIQDVVETSLMEMNYPDIAKAYILYRDNRARVRESNSRINKAIYELISVDAADSDTKRENANIDGNTMCGSMLKIGGTVTKQYFFNNVLSPEYKILHEKGVLHIHDADLALFAVNCIYIPLKQLLRKGFNTGHGFLRSPATIQSAVALACIALQSNQNDMFGGQSYPSLDYDLAPYVAKSHIRNIAAILEVECDGIDAEADYYNLKRNLIAPVDKYILEHDHLLTDEGKSFVFKTIPSSLNIDTRKFNRIWNLAIKKTKRDVYQAMEAMMYNFNTLQSRSGGQTPFSSVNFGTDTSEEGRMISKNLLLNIQKGLGAGETAIFPIAVFKILKGVTDKGSKNYDLFRLACETSALRMFPNFVNVSAPMNYKYYVPGRPETEIAAMGAITSGRVRLQTLPSIEADRKDSGYINIANVEQWLLDNNLTTTKEPIKFDEHTKYYEIVDGVKISDSSNACYADVEKFMIFNGINEGIEIDYCIEVIKNNLSIISENRYLVCTVDHPFPVKSKMIGGKLRRVPAVLLDKGDELLVSREVEDELRKRNIDYDRVEVKVVRKLHTTYRGDWYDFGTSTDKFDVERIVSHNCRTRVIGNSYDPTKEQTTGRGNLFFTTLNLPYLALLAKERNPGASKEIVYQEFMKILDKTMDDAMGINRERFNYIAKRKAKNFPFLMGQHLYVGSENLGPEDTIEEVIKNGTLSIGFLGLAETLTALFGKHHGESEESQKYGLEIIGHMNDFLVNKSKEEHLNYSLFATPAEGCSGRLLRATKHRFGVVKGVTDKPYFTNSVHVPVKFEISAADKIDIEAPYHPLCPAGIIGYIELDYDATKNIDAFEALVDYMADSGMTYFSINHPVDHDPVCGYVGYFPDGVCPRCGRKEGEGVTVRRLLELSAYNPTPEYAIDRSMVENDDIVANPLDPKFTKV